MNIMINGRAGVGKDVVADYLVDKYNFTKISFAEPIYQIARDLFGMEVKDRKLLQDIGQKMREIDPNVWVKYAYKKAKQYDNIVISDIRQANEYLEGIKENFFAIKLVSDLDIRIDRLRKRDGIEPDTNLLENDCETGADDFYYYEIENNGNLEDLYKKIDEIIR